MYGPGGWNSRKVSKRDIIKNIVLTQNIGALKRLVGEDISYAVDFATKWMVSKMHKKIATYLTELVMKEIVKCVITLILNKKKIVNKDLLSLIIEFKYKKNYQFYLILYQLLRAAKTKKIRSFYYI